MPEARLFHSVHRSRLNDALREGIRAASAFDDLGLEMRRGVVYCWLAREDDKLSSGNQRPDHVYLEVTVDADRCTVAEMDFAGLAIMYRHGPEESTLPSAARPANLEASRLLAELYRVTAVPLSGYRPGMFFTPEVLVRGNIAPECVRLADADRS